MDGLSQNRSLCPRESPSDGGPPPGRSSQGQLVKRAWWPRCHRCPRHVHAKGLLPGSAGSLRAARASQTSGDREAHLVANISLATWAWLEGPGAHVRSGEGGRLGGGRPLTPTKTALPLEVSCSGHERRWAPVGGLSGWSQKARGPHRRALPSGPSLSAGSTGPMLGGILGRDPAWTENANANADSFWVFHNFQKCLDGGQF